MLHFAGMLSGGVDQNRTVIGGNGKGDLAFQIEVLLTADLHGAGAALWRRRNRLAEIAVNKRVVGKDYLTGSSALFDRHVGLFRIDLDLSQQRGAACGVAGDGNDSEDRLVMEEDAAFGKDRLVGSSGRNIVFARNVRRR